MKTMVYVHKLYWNCIRFDWAMAMNFFVHTKSIHEQVPISTKILAQQLLLLSVRLVNSVAWFVESHFDTDFWHALNRSIYKIYENVGACIFHPCGRCGSVSMCFTQRSSHHMLESIKCQLTQYIHAPSKANNHLLLHTRTHYCLRLAVKANRHDVNTRGLRFCGHFLPSDRKTVDFSRLRSFVWMNVTQRCRIFEKKKK